MSDPGIFRNGWIFAAFMTVASVAAAIFCIRGVKKRQARKEEVVLALFVAVASGWVGVTIFKMWQLSMVVAK